MRLPDDENVGGFDRRVGKEAASPVPAYRTTDAASEADVDGISVDLVRRAPATSPSFRLGKRAVPSPTNGEILLERLSVDREPTLRPRRGSPSFRLGKRAGDPIPHHTGLRSASSPMSLMSSRQRPVVVILPFYFQHLVEEYENNKDLFEIDSDGKYRQEVHSDDRTTDAGDVDDEDDDYETAERRISLRSADSSPTFRLGKRAPDRGRFSAVMTSSSTILTPSQSAAATNDVDAALYRLGKRLAEP